MSQVGKCLLDTTVVVALLRNISEAVSFVASVKEVYLPSIGVGELAYGAQISNNRMTNVLLIKRLAESATILDVKQSTAFVYAKVKKGLKEAGSMIPENDIWIAALAIENNLPIATYDKHFASIIGLRTLKL